MIDGVVVEARRQFLDERGKVMHMLRSDSPLFTKFGEMYFSVVNPGVIKAWKYHKEATLFYAVPVGNIKIAVYDDREGSPTKGEIQEIYIGEDNYSLVKIPPLLWSGFKGISAHPAVIANCTDIPHDPEEIVRTDPFENNIPYDWSLVHG